MLTRVKVCNVGNIEEADIRLAPFTVFVGPSRSGKSTLLRALRALFTNQTGNRLIRKGASSATVAVETDDGHSIRWEKSKNTSKYVLDDREFTKLAGSVPAEIDRVLGIRPVAVDASLNLWPQYNAQGEYSFLVPNVGWSSGQLARACARLTRLDIVIEAQNLARTQLREIRMRKQRSQEELDRLVKKREAVSEVRGIIEQAENTGVESLIDRFERVLEARSLLPRLKTPLIVLPDVEPIRKRLTALEALLSLADSLREEKALSDRVRTLKDDRKKIEAELNSVDVCPVCKRPWRR